MSIFRAESAVRAVEVDAERCTRCPTRKACVASSLSAEEQALVPTYMSCSDAIDRGEHLYRAGDTAVAQFHVRSGMVKTYVISASGDEWVTGLFLPGEVVGLARTDGVYAESAIALECVSVCVLKEDDLEIAANFPRALVRHFVRLSASQQRQQLNLRQTSAEVRVAAFFIDYSIRLAKLGRDPAFLPTPMSRTDLASYLGMALASLSRVVSRFNAARILDAGRHAIEIREMDALRTIALPALT